MSTIQAQISDAEVLAIKEVEAATQKLSQKYKEAGKKARDLFTSAQKDADSVFQNKKEILEKKIQEIKDEAFLKLESNFEDLTSKKTELLKKGVSFLLTRISK